MATFSVLVINRSPLSIRQVSAAQFVQNPKEKEFCLYLSSLQLLLSLSIKADKFLRPRTPLVNNAVIE